jgi:hypothetical protein
LGVDSKRGLDSKSVAGDALSGGLVDDGSRGGWDHDAFGVLADTTRRWHPSAADHYARAIARGHDHPRAIRTLGRAWWRVIWRCWPPTQA